MQEVIDRFDKIAETSIDLTEKLKLIKETSTAFLKLAIPLGALLAASLDIVGKVSIQLFVVVSIFIQTVLF